jgi:hypothetical protein
MCCRRLEAQIVFRACPLRFDMMICVDVVLRQLDDPGMKNTSRRAASPVVQILLKRTPTSVASVVCACRRTAPEVRPEQDGRFHGY